MEDTNLKMDIIKDYLNSTNSNTIDLKILLRLYSNYSKIAKILPLITMELCGQGLPVV